MSRLLKVGDLVGYKGLMYTHTQNPRVDEDIGIVYRKLDEYNVLIYWLFDPGESYECQPNDICDFKSQENQFTLLAAADEIF